MAISNLSTQYISESFQNLLQYSSSGYIYNGLGNLLTNAIFPSASYSLTASLALNIAPGLVPSTAVSYSYGIPGVAPISVDSKLRQIISVKDFGAVGDGVTEDQNAIQAAIDYAIQNRKALYVPAGTYILNKSGSAVNDPIYISNFTENSQSLYMYGDGPGNTIFKAKDGLLNSIAVSPSNYARTMKMFYAYTNNTRPYSGHTWIFQNMSFDKNAKTNTDPVSRGTNSSGYEQSHIFSWAEQAPLTWKPNHHMIKFENCEFIDKTGACINIGSTTGSFESIVINDSLLTYHPTIVKYPSSVWGERGDLEFSTVCDLISVNGVQARYSQIEPVSSRYSNTPNKRRLHQISNSSVDIIEYTDTGDANESYSYLRMSNCYVSSSLLVRGMYADIINTEWSTPVSSGSDAYGSTYFTSYGMNVTNCRINLLPVSGTLKDSRCPGEVSGSVRQLLLRRSYGTVNFTGSFNFTNCDFVIPIVGTQYSSTNFAVAGTLESGGDRFDQVQANFTNCKFDRRLYGTVDALNSGTFTFSNCLMAGLKKAVRAGSTSTNYVGNVTLNDCDFYYVSGSYLDIQSTSAAQNKFKVIVNGTYDITEWRNDSGSDAAYVNGTVYNYYAPRLVGSTAPTGGFWYKNDVVAALTSSFVCIASGIPGTWQERRPVTFNNSTSTFSMTGSLNVSTNLIAAKSMQIPASSSSVIADTGSMYINTSTNKLYIYNGTTWKTASLG